MSTPKEAATLIENIRPLVSSDRSLSVKMRFGETENKESLLAFCNGLQDAGADFLTLHPRVRKDPWSRPARWSYYRELSDSLQIPLVANGDIRNVESVRELSEVWLSAGADPSGRNLPAGLMIGRAAIQKPWIFSRIHDYLSGINDTKTWDLLEIAERFHELLELYQPKDFWFTRAKRFHAYFCNNLVFGHRIAANIQTIGTYAEILPFFRAYLEANPAERFVTES